MPKRANLTAKLDQALVSARSRIKNIQSERDKLAGELNGVIQRAQALLDDLGVSVKMSAGKPGRKRGAKGAKRGRKKGYKLPAATRRKMKDAWKRRKAEAAKKTKPAQ